MGPRYSHFYTCALDHLLGPCLWQPLGYLTAGNLTAGTDEVEVVNKSLRVPDTELISLNHQK